MPVYFGGSGVTPSLKTGFNRLSLDPGQTWLIQPAGWYYIRPGQYTVIQQYDPILQTWVQVGGSGFGAADEQYFWSDGVNYRLANLTGCAVGAYLTNRGSGYVAAPTVTASAGGSLWRAVVGGLVNTSVVVSNGGTNYTYPPIVTFAAPPPGGIQATGYATISAGVVTGITVTNQGGGYTSPPAISIVNDPREGQNNVPQGYGAAAVCTLTGAGTLAGIICIDPGKPTGANVIPTLTISPQLGSAAATALMCWSITSFQSSSYAPGTTLAGSYALITAVDTLGPPSTSVVTNPSTEYNWVKTRSANILGPITSNALPAYNSATFAFYDGGIYATVPSVICLTAAGPAEASPVVIIPNMGGLPDTSYISS